MLWMLLLAGCWEPTETSATGMAGHILDHTGFPIADVEVTSLEGRSITKSDGHFAVEYQAPDTYVSFDIGATTFRRNYQAVDEGDVVELKLPSLSDVRISCEAACSGRLQWAHDGGLTARAALRCEPGLDLTLEGVPTSLPEVLCRGEEVELTRVGRNWTLRPQSRNIEVRANGDETCRISIGSTIATRVKDLAADARVVYMGRGSGDVLVKGMCGEVPVVPVHAAADVVSVEVVPNAGQVWDLGAEGLDAVDIYGVPDVGESWSLRLTPQGSSVTTPVLPPGHYAFLAPDALPMDPSSLQAAMSEQVPGELVQIDEGRVATWRLRVAQ